MKKLPDKGQKIRYYYGKVQAEMLCRSDVELAADRFSVMNIADEGKRRLTNMEWTGSVKDTDRQEGVDSDDDEVNIDPLKVIARSNEVSKIVKIVKPQNLITNDDLREIESFKQESRAESDSSIQVSHQRNRFIYSVIRVFFIFQKS